MKRASAASRPLTAVVARSAEGNRWLSTRLKRLGMRPISVETVEFL